MDRGRPFAKRPPSRDPSGTSGVSRNDGRLHPIATSFEAPNGDHPGGGHRGVLPPDRSLAGGGAETPDVDVSDAHSIASLIGRPGRSASILKIPMSRKLNSR